MSMRKVINVNLNGKAFQIEDLGYESLRRYLDQAEAQLAGNPDRQEILGDLEQAIADKCGAFLGMHKSVVSTAEVEQVLREMGPVESSVGESQDGRPAIPAAPVRRLYRIAEKKLLAGVCTGLAAYFAVDVVFVRVIVVLLSLCTGVVALAYLLLIFIVPRADSPTEVAAAHGLPFNARDVIDRAKKKVDAFRAA
jgi:phage shock protein PspC (stress-responsive transcriptional regulator)